MTPIGHTVPPLVTPRGTKRPNKLAKGIFAGFAIFVVLALVTAWVYLEVKKNTQQQEKAINGPAANATVEPASSPLHEGESTASAPPPPASNPPATDNKAASADPPPPPPPANWSPKPPILANFTSDFTREQPVAPQKTRAQLIREDLERTMQAPLVPTAQGPRQPETNSVNPAPINPVVSDPNAELARQLVHPSQITPDAYERQNNQEEKESFYRTDPERRPLPVLAVHNETGNSCTVRAGWSIPAELVTAINSDLPGLVRARVRRNVYDTDTGQCLAIPQGSILIGEYNSRLGFGQDRLQTKWITLQCPREDPISLAGMSGNAPDGSSGLEGHMNRRIGRLVAYTGLAALFSAGIQISQTRGQATGPYGYPTVGQAAANGIGNEVGQSGRALIERSANQQPTYTAPAGTFFEATSTADLVFTGAYRAR